MLGPDGRAGGPGAGRRGRRLPRHRCPASDGGHRLAARDRRARTARVDGRGDFVALQDAMAPEIALDVPPPAATANAWLDLAGQRRGRGRRSPSTAPPARLDGGPLRRRADPGAGDERASRSSPPTPSATSRSSGSRPSTTSTRPRSCRRRSSRPDGERRADRDRGRGAGRLGAAAGGAVHPDDRRHRAARLPALRRRRRAPAARRCRRSRGRSRSSRSSVEDYAGNVAKRQP